MPTHCCCKAACLQSSPRGLMEVFMQTDVVCGMKVDPADAPAKSEYNGRTYYFCSNECKKRFEAEPDRYLKNQPAAQFAR